MLKHFGAKDAEDALQKSTLTPSGAIVRMRKWQVPSGEPRMADRIFISFASADKSRAAAACAALERAGQPCWIAYRDVLAGQNYQGAIVHALETAKAMVLVFSARTNESDEVSKELSLASAFKIPVIPLRVEEALPRGALHYELATRQWIDGFDHWDRAMAELVAAIGMTGDRSSVRKPVTAPLAAANGVKPRISEQAIESAQTALMIYIGPIAPVLARKEAAAAASLDDFHERLSRRIRSSEDQAAFLARVRRTPH